MALIQIRIDEEDKHVAQAVLSSMGLTLSGGVKLFLKKVVNEGKIPFDITAGTVVLPKKQPPVSTPLSPTNPTPKPTTTNTSDTTDSPPSQSPQWNPFTHRKIG